MHGRSLLSLLLLLVGIQQSQAQTFIVVKDIYPGQFSSLGQLPEFTDVNGTLFFVAADGSHARELWRSNGTVNGTVLVRDIRAGGLTSGPTNLTNVNGRLFFTADDGVNGAELWKSDGTTEGTVLVKQINPGPASASVRFLTNVNGTLFFSADDGATGLELWKSDGTVAGTVLVKDINSGPGSGFSGSASVSIAVNGMFFFEGNDGITFGELWKSDGTTTGTVLVKDINPVSESFPFTLANVNGTLFFGADDGSTGHELWKSDGTATGTVLVKDINPGPGTALTPQQSAFGNRGIAANGTLFFWADDGNAGLELWKSDGTADGTVLLKDINPGPANSAFISSGLGFFNGMIFFEADDGTTGRELWKTDGTAAGTVLVKDINPSSASSTPRYFFALKDAIYFSADNGINGSEIWKSDGSAAGTVLVADINPGVPSSSPRAWTEVNGTLFFAAIDAVVGRELWKAVSDQPGVAITATPQNPPVIIPSGGGFFDFDVTIANNTSSPFSGNYWNTLTLPTGEEIGPQLGPFNVTVAAGGSFSTTLTMEVPSRPPPGTYSFNMKVGVFPGTVLDTDSFTFNKSAGSNANETSAAFSDADWELISTYSAIAPGEFALEQNYSNPFNPTTTISFSLLAASEVTLAIHNLRGQFIRTLHSGPMAAGHHQVVWDGSDSHGIKVASGLYSYQLEAQSVLGRRPGRFQGILPR